MNPERFCSPEEQKCCKDGGKTTTSGARGADQVLGKKKYLQKSLQFPHVPVPISSTRKTLELTEAGAGLFSLGSHPKSDFGV